MRTQGQFSLAATCSMWRRFPGAVIALDHDAPIEGKAREDSQRRVPVEKVVGIEFRDVLACLRIGWNFHRAIDAEDLTD